MDRARDYESRNVGSSPTKGTVKSISRMDNVVRDTRPCDLVAVIGELSGLYALIVQW